MILVYPAAYDGTPPKYLVTGDKAFYLSSEMSAHNFARVGIPLVPVPQSSIDWVLDKLDPGVEHPLA